MLTNFGALDREKQLASSALVLARPASPQPPSTASVSRTHVLPTSEGSPAAAATRSVKQRGFPD